MRLRMSSTGIACLLIVVAGLLPACDFRQMIEDRPVKLPEESTEPKETHSAEAGQRADPTGPARTK